LQRIGQFSLSLTKAYDSKTLRGKALLKAKKLIDERQAQAKSSVGEGHVRDEPVTVQKVMRVFQVQSNKHRVLVRKAKLSETRMLFIVTAMKSLLADDNFVTLLRAELLDSLLKEIVDQVNGKGFTQWIDTPLGNLIGTKLTARPSTLSLISQGKPKLRGL
jgi:ParB family chromosome partitioning protein